MAYPDIDWVSFSNDFVEESLGLHRSQVTTQIEHYDNLAALFDNFKRVNTILIDLCRDVWTYISMDYFKQKIKAGEVGSSAMPHSKSIDFENAEGNLGMANAILSTYLQSYPFLDCKRLDRLDGVEKCGLPMAHTILAFKSMLNGLNKLILNDAINTDLDDNWAVVAEAIQTVLRRKAIQTLRSIKRINAY